MITSARSPRARALKRLGTPENRDRSGLALVEGPNALASALEAGATIDILAVTRRAETNRAALLKRAAAIGATRIRVADAVMAAICRTATPPALVASVRVPADRPQPDTSVLIHGMNDPAGLGAVLQFCAVNGWGAQIASGSVDPFSPKVIRASNAAAWWIPVVGGVDPVEAVQRARSEGRRSVAIGPDGDEPPAVRPERSLLVVGSAATRLDVDMRFAAPATAFPLGPSVSAIRALSAWTA
ncbi:MAG: TrmH family RNA methyltransferase [Actinomycetota bacterium]